MKNYEIMTDITMSKTFYVEAESQAEAEKKVAEMMDKDPYGQAKSTDAYVGYVVTDVFCPDDEN